MRKINLSFLLFVLLTAAFPGAAQTAKAYELNIQGVKVVVQPAGNDIVVIQTIVKGGVQNYPAAKAGIESLAMTALTECGTAKDDKNSFKDKLDKVSAQVSGFSGMDYGAFTLNCIKSDFETVWPLYTDALLHPRFDTKEFDRIKQDAINGIRAAESNPDNALNRMAMQNAFRGQNYAKDPSGTLTSVKALTAGETKKYWQTLLTRSRLAIVVVGDLPKETIEARITDLLKQIPAGTPFKQAKSVYKPAANTFQAQPRDNATNYIQGISGAPQPGSPDYNAFVLAMRIFYSKHFLEIRTNNGLSYAPGIWFSQGLTPFSNIYVTTTDPDKYVAVARKLVEKIRTEGFSAEELKNMKTEYVTNVYYRQETNEAQAGSLAFNEVTFGNWKRANTIKDDMDKVTLDQLNNAFRKYFTNITWSYQGDPKKVTPQMFTQPKAPELPAEKKAF